MSASAAGEPVRLPLPARRALLCATGLETSADAVAARLERHDTRRATGAARADCSPLLHELRLDAIWPWDEEVLALTARPDVLVCCRARADGGLFRGSEAERLALLRRAAARGPGLLDIELETDAPARAELFELATAETRIVLSVHRHGAIGAAEAAALGARLSAARADVLKVALTLEDTADATLLLELCADEPRPVLRVGMGPGGLVTRLLPDAFGSPWSYVTALGALPSASGQLAWETARRWRVGSAERLVPIGLLGGPGVLRSPGPWAYNHLFAQEGWPFQYVPLPTARPAEALALCERLGFLGVSVTMPAKHALLGELDELRGAADRVGAVNTVLLADGRRVGLNTDVSAVARLLGHGEGRRALVLGAGGAARAAVVAAMRAGWRVSVSARDGQQAAAVAEPHDAQVVAWSARGRAPFDALVNATPVGGDAASEPLGLDPDEAPSAQWAQRVVLDMVLSPEPTPLVRAAAARGAKTIDGLAMWFVQGAEQMSAVTGHELTAPELRAAWTRAAPPDWPAAQVAVSGGLEPLEGAP